ncbi:MAG: hypothetical protein Q4E06_12985 [Lautropia sp.]|nr:hypothetical protein [Lautropia sp.]
MKCIKQAGLGFAFLMGVAIVGIGYAPEASAQRGCYGNLVATQDIRGGFDGNGALLGRLQIFYRPENNGTNVACVIHYGDFVGKSLHTSAAIRKCGSKSYYDRSGCNRYQSSPDVDEGFFTHYAGPATVTNTNGRCVNVYGHIQIPGQQFARKYEIYQADCGLRPIRRTDITKLW